MPGFVIGAVKMTVPPAKVNNICVVFAVAGILANIGAASGGICRAS
jgi:hypothetical protein